MEPRIFESEIGGRKLIIETGKLAGQANGAVTVRYGDTEILVTVCFKQEVREGVDFLPLTIDYEERLYAAGKIPGGFIRREGRPSEEAILACRLTDRPIRPLLPKAWRKDIQLIVTVLSVDMENDPDIMAVIGCSVALAMSEIPFAGPVGAVHVGYINGELVLNPALAQLDDSQLDLVVVSTSQEIIMIEAKAKEISEDIVFKALQFGHEANQEIIKLQERLQQSCGKPKLESPVKEISPEAVAAVAAIDEEKVARAILMGQKAQRDQALSELKSELLQSLGESVSQDEVASAFEARCKSVLRNAILEKQQRPGGRNLTEIRSLDCEVGLLPRTHGSALFTRGQTQVLSIATLGSTRREQMLDGLGVVESKRFIHHYNFTPFSTGEVKRSGSTSRREIGHGALAERALAQVMPDDKEFPYTIRLVSEVLSSSGSTSMASVCAGSLCLMDAGIPVKSAVSGIAMGLVTGEDGKFAVLTDIEGLEDAYGDMDFKIAGTKEGITAMQMDTKLKGLSFEIIKQTLDQGKVARLFILDKMNETISSNRSEVSRYAPRMHTMMINVEKIGAVIGPGGKTIRAIIEKTKATIDINDDGTVIIGSSDVESSRKAIEMIEGLTKDVEVGTTYTGKVTRILDFGAMVEILPGKEGLVHISELADYRVPKVGDVVKIGDEVNVKVINIDNMGRINLSRKALLEGASQTSGDQAQDSRGYPSTDRPRFNEERRRPENRNFPRRSD